MHHQVGLLLLVLWSISSLHREAHAGRYLMTEEHRTPKLLNSTRSGEDEADNGHGFIATVKREVPSGSDPLHN
uniref:Uncharacterized protein n=1 Tax=Kalanchoe fedtschenkoi TaxID=63787 RepID=A0A7N0U5W7_KALFE